MFGCEPAIPPDKLEEMKGKYEIPEWGKVKVPEEKPDAGPDAGTPPDGPDGKPESFDPKDYEEKIEGPPTFEPESGVSGTFSILAVDPESGIVGGAVASMYPAVGRVVVFARGGVGAFATQHWHHPPWGEQALDLLQRGQPPAEVVAHLLKGDERRERRQLAAIDRRGRAINRNPSAAALDGNWWGSAGGKFYVCQGNLLAGREVISNMAAAYETTEGSLADRLMAALLAGDRAGGDARGRLAAGIRIAKPETDGYWLELYVDKSDDAVNDLVKQYAQLQHAAQGGWTPPAE
jgi:uncharacterized Ntn-hydrolase superfamily protein